MGLYASQIVTATLPGSLPSSACCTDNVQELRGSSRLEAQAGACGTARDRALAASQRLACLEAGAHRAQAQLGARTKHADSYLAAVGAQDLLEGRLAAAAAAADVTCQSAVMTHSACNCRQVKRRQFWAYLVFEVNLHNKHVPVSHEIAKTKTCFSQ